MLFGQAFYIEELKEKFNIFF